MSSWEDLASELDCWRESGRTATFWWRDDDATAPSPALDRLLKLHRRYAAPITLAVIPARAEPDLAKRLDEPSVTVVQHGWAHANHAPVGAPKAEFGPHRPLGFMLGELARGQLVMDALFGRWTRVLVPPHNRIAGELAAALSTAGYVGLSTYGARKKGPAPGLVQINAHIDIMNWTTRAFGGTDVALRLAIAHLHGRRTGAADPEEPTGLLTHHLAHDEAAWAFVDAFLAALNGHPAAAVVDAATLFRT